jgi:hypothetical protein
MEQVIPLDQVQREAREAAKEYADVNAACPYPFDSDAGHAFRAEFNAMRASLSVAPELRA